MFYPIEGGSHEEIFGLKCQIPPEGYIYDFKTCKRNPITGLVDLNTGKLKKIGVHKGDYMYENCIWKRDDRFNLYKSWKKDEDRMLAANPSFVHEELDKFIEECWLYRMGGFWFYNNKKPTYITGSHWFNLSCVAVTKGNADYRDEDRRLHYHWNYCINDPKCYGQVVITKRRYGKCLGIDTPIRMYDGSVKMVQDICNGEYVMGVNSQPRLVSGVTSGSEEMFEIQVNKGNNFTCNKSHLLWLLWNNTATHTKYGWKQNECFALSVGEYIELKNWEKEHIVMLRSGWDVVTDDVQHKIHPYMLGLWLGDGGSSSQTFTSKDKEILEYVNDYANSIGLVLKHTSKYDYRIQNESSNKKCSIEIKGERFYYNSVSEMIADAKTKNITANFCKHKREILKYEEDKNQSNNWLCLLKEMDLFGNKHIPREYIIDSRKNRLELLAGLIDTDGHAYSPKGNVLNYEITQKSKRIADGIVEIARSLGFYVSVKEKIATLKREGKETYKCLVYRICINGNFAEIPCRVERKKPTLHNGRINHHRTGFKVNSIGDGDYYGFEVDGDHLFLLADGIVVHNTSYAGGLALEMATRNKMFNVGIQSMNKDESKGVYAKAIISPYKKMPYFFQVEHSNITQSQESLRFLSKKLEDVEDELESAITFKPSGETAYDGWRLSFYYGDEVGKTEGVDIVRRWGVVRPCLEDHNGDVIGKALHTSTVEDMSGTAENFLAMWKDSDPAKIDPETMQTPSGQYKFFVNSVKTIDLDKYGFANEEMAMRKIMARRKQFADKPRELSELIRKTPISEEEAFQIDAKDCPYNAIKLNDQLTFINFCDYELFEVGNLEWIGEKYKSGVKFVPNPNGRFSISEHPIEGFENAHTEYGGKMRPSNNHIYAGGCDPYDHAFIDLDGKKGLSDGAIAIIHKDGTLHKSAKGLDGGVVLFYRCRVSNPDIFYEDAMKAAVYYGCEILIEVNKTGCDREFEKRGLDLYSAKLKGAKDRGLVTNQDTNKDLSGLTDIYIENYAEKSYFKPLITDWLKFDVNKTTKFDGAMAVGIALILIDDRSMTKKSSGEQLDIKKLIPYL